MTENKVQTFNSWESKPRLHFNDQQKFKIVQFTDLHYGENPWTSWGPNQDRRSN
eukprot:Pgem_evm1s17017